MPSLTHDFMFDTDFGFGNESVFCPIENVEATPTPPIEGYFLLLQTGNPPFLLLNGQYMTLL